MTISRRLASDLSFWRKVRDTPVRKRREIAKSLKAKHVCDLCEIYHNIRRGKCQMDSETFKKLKRRRKLVRVLADRTVPVEERQRVIQSGSGLPLLTLAALVAVPVIESIIRKTTSKR